MAPSRPITAPEVTDENKAIAKTIHSRLDQWAERVLAGAIGRGQPVRWVVARVTTEGLDFLMDPDLAHFTKVRGHVQRFTRKDEAGSAMVRGYDATKAAYGPRAAAIYWRGQRVLPVHHDLEDLP